MAKPASTPISVIDAFATQPFRGNPAAVCLLADTQPSDSWMQFLAADMNLSETAYLQPRQDGFSLRWFTPTREVDLCGHATLASAHFLWESGILEQHELARFHTRSGLLTATRFLEDQEAWIELDFPAQAPVQVDIPAKLQAALGINSVLYTGKNQTDLVVEVGLEDQVRALSPDLIGLAAIDARGVIVTARGTGDFDCVSRAFYPRYGIPEDPVTGSAHCALAPYWALKLGKQDLLAYQASARGGVLRLRTEANRVKIAGQAVTIWSGTLSKSAAPQ